MTGIERRFENGLAAASLLISTFFALSLPSAVAAESCWPVMTFYDGVP
jgi:hypothetical protein